MSETPAAEFVSFSIDDMAEMVDFDNSWITEFSSENVRAWLRARPSKTSAIGMRTLLTNYADAVSEGHLQTWDGFSQQMTPREWLQALAEIAHLAVDGKHFEPLRIEDMRVARNLKELQREAEIQDRARRRKARIEIMRAAAPYARWEDGDELKIAIPDDWDDLARQDSAASSQKLDRTTTETEPTLISAESMKEEETIAAASPAAEEDSAKDGPSEVFLPQRLSPWLTLPHIIVRGRLIYAGPRQIVRPVYTREKPLRIDKISGLVRDSIEIEFIGEALFLSDIETYAHVLRLAASTPLGERLPPVRVESLRRQIGRTKSARANEALVAQLHRLRNAEISVWTSNEAVLDSWKNLFPKEGLFKRHNVDGVKVSFKLLGDLVEIKSEKKGNTVEFTTEISKYARVFFGQTLSSWYSELTYGKIPGDIAKRLYLFYQSHDGTWPFSSHELYDYLGGIGDHKTFDATLKSAHDALVAADFLKSWKLEPSKIRGGRKAFVLECL